MMQRPVPRRRVPIKKRAAAAKPVRRRRVVPRPRPRRVAAPRTAHGPLIVQRAASHLKELYAKRDCAYFVHQVFTEIGLVFPQTSTLYFPPMGYFIPVKTPLAGDIALYADHMGIYAGGNQIIIADPGPQQIFVSTINSFLNFKGYYRWYQDVKRGI